MRTRTEIEALVRQMLVEVFELPHDAVTPEARLFEELDLDSIDAIDMSLKLEEATGLKLRGEDMRAIRTVTDITDALEAKLIEHEASTG